MNEQVNPIHPSPSLSPSPMGRRRALGLLGLGSVALLAACADGAASSTSSASSTGTADTSGSTPPTPTAAVGPDTTAAVGSALGEVDASTATPGETGGPFPSDGSNDNGEGTVADVLHDPRAVRTDIRGDLDGSNVQVGVPLSLTVRTVAQGSGEPLAGAALYVWHCNRDGAYSQYSSAMAGGDYTDRSFLRGVQITDADGVCTFTTILPGRYQGRAFHIHFEVYADGTYADRLLTSQMAIDDDLVDSLYAQASGYEAALRNDTDNSRDNVFADGVEHQLLTVSGDVDGGLRAEFVAVV